MMGLWAYGRGQTRPALSRAPEVPIADIPRDRAQSRGWMETLAGAVGSFKVEILEPRAVVDAVGHDGQALQLGLPTGHAIGIEQNGPGDVFGQFLLDLPHQLAALLHIG